MKLSCEGLGVGSQLQGKVVAGHWWTLAPEELTNRGWGWEQPGAKPERGSAVPGKGASMF